MRLRVISERVVQLSPLRDRAFLEAYTKGVNAYIDQHRGNLPHEFRVLRAMNRGRGQWLIPCWWESAWAVAEPTV